MVADPNSEHAREVRVNGVLRAWKPDWKLLNLLDELEATGAGVAVERNQAVIRRVDYAECTLQPGDEVEIVRLVGGG